MLILKDLGKTPTSCFFCVLVSIVSVIKEYWNQQLVDFWHVKKMKHFFQVPKKLFVLTPPSCLILNVVDENHQSL
jgi:hypothetical protein